MGLGTLVTKRTVPDVDVSDGRVLLKGRSQCLAKRMPCSGEQAPEALGLGALVPNFVEAEVNVSDCRVLLKGRSQRLEKGCRA